MLALTACEDGSHLFIRDEIFEIEPDGSPVRYSVFFESEPIRLAMHEPPSGTLIGMYTDTISLDNRVIRQVESLTGVSHATFMEAMLLGDPFPQMWILECMAEQKIPITVILPPEDGNPFNLQLMDTLSQTAAAFGSFNLPMFIVFYPVPANSRWSPDDYIAFFRHARAIFAVHAPKAAFIWSVDVGLEDFKAFYPGELAADWVGLSVFCQEPDTLERALEFYHTFQETAPIMLNLGIAHFSIDGHRYSISEAAATLELIYKTVLEEFPRVRMINYMNLSLIDYSGHDYRVSGDPALREAYRNSVQMPGFLTRLPNNIEDIDAVQAIRSAYYAYIEDGHIYLDVRIVTEELGLSAPRDSRWIGGARRVDPVSAGLSVELRQGQVWIK